MAYIRVDQAIPVFDGQPVTFKSPASCKGIEGLKVYYPVGKGTAVATFALADAHGNNVGSIDLFAANVLVKVILDTDQGMAYVQNADTNAYLEGRLAKIEGGAVKKSGDTMTGNLMVAKSSPYLHLKNTGTARTARMAATSDNYLSLYNEVTDDASKNRTALWLGPETNNADRLLSVNHILNGTTTTYIVLHTGNTNRTKLVAEATTPANEGEIYWRYK